MWIRSNFAFIRVIDVWLGLAVCFLYLQDSQKRSFASDILILMYNINRLISSLLRWFRRWYYCHRVDAWIFLFLFLFLFLIPLLLLVTDNLEMNVIVFVDRSEAFCANNALGFFYIINAVDGVAILYGIGKRINYSFLCSAIRTVRFPIYNIYFIDSQSNMGLWERKFMNIIKLILNMNTSRTSVNTSLVRNSIIFIVIAENNILLSVSIILISQISYVVN
jgi:hypothetical protein